MQVRAVTAADKGEWLRMRLALWPDSMAADELPEMEAFLSGETPLPETLHAAFVCENPAGGCCGLLELSIKAQSPGCRSGRIGYLEALYVDPSWRRRGVARALIAAGEAWARAECCREMASDTTPEYPTSPATHEALGYQEVVRYFRKKISND